MSLLLDISDMFNCSYYLCMHLGSFLYATFFEVNIGPKRMNMFKASDTRVAKLPSRRLPQLTFPPAGGQSNHRCVWWASQGSVRIYVVWEVTKDFMKVLNCPLRTWGLVPHHNMGWRSRMSEWMCHLWASPGFPLPTMGPRNTTWCLPASASSSVK